MLIQDFCRVATQLDEEINVLPRVDGYVVFFFDHSHDIKLLTSENCEAKYCDDIETLEKLLTDNSYHGAVHYFESQSFTIIN